MLGPETSSLPSYRDQPIRMHLIQLWLQELYAAEFIKEKGKEVSDQVKCGYWEVVPIFTVPKGNKLTLPIWLMECK